MKNVRPIFVMHDGGVPVEMIQAAREAVNELLSLAFVQHMVPVRNYGIWRHSNHRDHNGLIPYHSLEWYLNRARAHGRPNGQLNADVLVQLLTIEPWRQAENHYDLMLTSADLFSEGCNFVIGLARKTVATVVSHHRFGAVEPRMQRECFKTAVLHEFGHVLGLPDESRGQALTENLGGHCTNECVMRQGLNVPHDWIRFTRDRLVTDQPLCHLCQRDLVNYFK